MTERTVVTGGPGDGTVSLGGAKTATFGDRGKVKEGDINFIAHGFKKGSTKKGPRMTFRSS